MKKFSDIKEEMLMDLLLKRMLYLDGKIDAEKTKAAGIAMAWLNAKSPEKKISLYIDSFGGNVTEGLTMYDMFVNSAAPVTGIVCRRASSMASVVLQGCKERLAYNHATILIHNITRDGDAVLLDQLENKGGFQKLLREMQSKQEKVYRIYAKRTGKSISQIRAVCKRNRLMDVREALKFGLIDKIV